MGGWFEWANLFEGPFREDWQCVCIAGGRKCLPGGQTQTPALPHPGLAACGLLTNPGERLLVLRAHWHTLTAALAFHLASPLTPPSSILHHGEQVF